MYYAIKNGTVQMRQRNTYIAHATQINKLAYLIFNKSFIKHGKKYNLK